MKNNRIYKAFSMLFLGASLAGVMGCSDFLLEEDPSNLTPESYYTIPDHAEAALAAVYAGLRFIGGDGGFFLPIGNCWKLLQEPPPQKLPRTRI